MATWGSKKKDPETRRLALWYEHVPEPILELKEELSPGAELPYTIWKSLNRLRVGVSRCKQNLARWGYTQDDKCECGATQDEQHLLNCEQLENTCTHDDLKCHTVI
ncbi:hypothetical protein M8J77_012679 [Diaphorina citri]|nr:hypothetical protein M8J77_012679 [Diaphorina citri]